MSTETEAVDADIPSLSATADGAMVMAVRGATLTFRSADECPPCEPPAPCTTPEPEPCECEVCEKLPEPAPLPPPPPPMQCGGNVAIASAAFDEDAGSPVPITATTTFSAAGFGLFPFSGKHRLAYRCVFEWGSRGHTASSPAAVSTVEGQSMCDAVEVACAVPRINSTHLESAVFDLGFRGLEAPDGKPIPFAGKSLPSQTFVSHGPSISAPSTWTIRHDPADPDLNPEGFDLVFEVGDADTPDTDLVVTARVSDSAVVAASGISIRRPAAGYRAVHFDSEAVLLYGDAILTLTVVEPGLGGKPGKSESAFVKLLVVSLSTTPTTTPSSTTPTTTEDGLAIRVEGHANVLVQCRPGDYKCQASEVCAIITGCPCVWQQYDCRSIARVHHCSSNTPRGLLADHLFPI